MTTPDLFDTPIRTQADLERTWRSLMGPLGFGGTSIWLFLIGPDDLPLRQITQIEEAVRPPSPESLRNFGAMLRQRSDEFAFEGRWAFLRSRPGRIQVTQDDRAWARGLHEACRTVGERADVVHLATDEDLVPLPMDELARSG